MGGDWFRLARPVPRETQKLLASMVGVLFLAAGGGALLFAVFGHDLVAHPLALGLVATIALAAGVMLLAAAQWEPEALFGQFDRLVYGLVFVATVNVTAGQWALGPRVVVVLVVLLEVPIFAFYLFPRRNAIASVALMGVALAVLFAVQDGYVAPVGQWGFFVGTALAVGLVVGGLLRRGVSESVEIMELQRFLPPAVADALLSTRSEASLAPHRRRIAVLFCDLRGFTRFSAGAEPEEVVEILNAYYETAGTALREVGATIGTFAGDGIMAYFNDPIPIEDPAGSAVDVAHSIRVRLDGLVEHWARNGFELGYGIGIAYGYATLGVIGFEGRYDYTALGSVINLAARLCGEAAHREILVDQKTAHAVRDRVALESRELELKGFGSVVAFRVDAVDPAHGVQL